MEIYYINIDEFTEKYNKNLLKQYLGNKDFKSVKRQTEYAAGRFLVLNAAKKIYSVENPEIIIINKKPKLKNGEIEFNISHCGNYVFAVLDKAPCGIDIQFMGEIDLKKFSKRYKKQFSAITDFYEFWTQKEAQIKLGHKPLYIKNYIFKKDYMMCIASDEILPQKPELKNFLGII